MAGYLSEVIGPMTDKELADLVRLTGLVDRAEGDRAVLLGAFLDLADMAGGDDGGDAMLRWRERGQQAMDAGPVIAPQSASAATAVPGCVTGAPNTRWPSLQNEPVRVVVRATEPTT